MHLLKIESFFPVDVSMSRRTTENRQHLTAVRIGLPDCEPSERSPTTMWEFRSRVMTAKKCPWMHNKWKIPKWWILQSNRGRNTVQMLRCRHQSCGMRVCLIRMELIATSSSEIRSLLQCFTDSKIQNEKSFDPLWVPAPWHYTPHQPSMSMPPTTTYQWQKWTFGIIWTIEK